jgi:hypothetical protein
MSWQKIGEWFTSALTFVARTVKALAPAAATVGAATGHSEVVGAANLAEVSAEAVERAIEDSKGQK